MHERSLRSVLLIRSIDEGDPAGEVLSLAERAEATRVAAQQSGTISQSLAGQTLPAPAEKLLVRRAELLSEKLRARSPVVSQMLSMVGGASWLGLVVLAVAFVVGFGMSALDGQKRIDVLAFPLLGLLAWNFLVYLVTLLAALRPRKVESSGSVLSSWYARWIQKRADALMRRSSHFNVPLAQAMQRFAGEWATIARPLLSLRAQRLFHFGAAVLAVGLIVGLYLRGLVLRYAAGWDSTFLDPTQVSGVLSVLYGPASKLSGIPLPAASDVVGLRWTGATGGASAAPFIHLIALTTLLYIIVPRLLLVVITSFAYFRVRRHPPLPASFMPYARALLRETGSVAGMVASVVTYAYAPSREALSGLGALMTEALGGDVKVDMRAAVAYGEEDQFAERLRLQPTPQADCHLLLMSLAATPESENHGAMIDAMARALSRRKASFLLVVDESSYAARMNAEASLSTRVAQRAQTWRDFAAARGQTACIVDLTRLRAGASEIEAQKVLREVLQRASTA